MKKTLYVDMFNGHTENFTFAQVHCKKCWQDLKALKGTGNEGYTA